MRKIVMLRPHDWLREAYRSDTSSFRAADENLNRTPGVRFEDRTPPLAVPKATSRARDEVLRVLTSPAPVAEPHSFMMTADFSDADAEARFEHDNASLVENIFADPAIEPFSVTCPPGAPIGTGREALEAIGAPTLHAAGLRGRAVRVVVVDEGVDGTRVPLSGGYRLFPGVAPGEASGGHGTMVAANVRLVAPDAEIFDCPLLQSRGGRVAFLSDAILAYAQILTTLLQQPGAMVLVNSWGMYSLRADADVGHRQNYSANAAHPFNLMVGTAAAGGADVVFAAGNCGRPCPDGRCGLHDVGPKRSIHGANSHPDAICVAGVTYRGARLGYSSQGGGALSPQKPDLAAPTHYFHSGVFPVDSGTSTSCPVVGGALAVLRSKPSVRPLPPAVLRTALLRGVVQAPGYAHGWNPDTGHGVLNLPRALAELP